MYQSIVSEQKNEPLTKDFTEDERREIIRRYKGMMSKADELAEVRFKPLPKFSAHETGHKPKRKFSVKD